MREEYVHDKICQDRDTNKKQAVPEDALVEFRAELPETQELPRRPWSLSEAQKINISKGVKLAYDALKQRDTYDWQARKCTKHDMRLKDKPKLRQSRKAANKGKEQGKGKSKKRVRNEEVDHLFPSHQ